MMTRSIRRPGMGPLWPLAGLAGGVILALAVASTPPCAAQAAGPAAQPPATQPVSDADREALVQKIREMAAKRAASQPAAKPPAPRRAPLASQPVPPGAAAIQPPATQPTTQAAGCGAIGEERLQPPPEGQPQPKYVCEQPRITREDVWKGEQAKFTFDIVNRGDAPLQIRLKKP